MTSRGASVLKIQEESVAVPPFVVGATWLRMGDPLH